MKPPVVLGLLGMLLISSQNARADSIVFPTSFSTSGTFDCRASIPCTGEGTNSVTIGSGANTATITFNGVNTSIDVTNHVQDVSLGEFSVAATDGFVFPVRPNNPTGLPILRFSLSMVQTLPVADTTGRTWEFGPGGKSSLTLMMGTPYLRTNNSSSAYPLIVYTLNPFPFTLKPDATTDLSAEVGASPEPASMVLLGTGLVGLIARKRRSANNPQVGG